MAVESSYGPPDRGCRPGDIEPLLKEVQELTWALLDENISSEESARLEQVLTDEEAARQIYLDCVQLHVELRQHFAEEPAVVGSACSSLLGFLDAAIAPLNVHPPQPSDSSC
jgi:hypothetical protein